MDWADFGLTNTLDSNYTFPFPEAALPFGDVEETIKEIERTAAMGFRSPCVSGSTSAPAPLSEARWDPIWARLQELRWPLCIHAGFNPAFDSSSQWLLKVPCEKKLRPKAAA